MQAFGAWLGQHDWRCQNRVSCAWTCLQSLVISQMHSDALKPQQRTARIERIRTARLCLSAAANKSRQWTRSFGAFFAWPVLCCVCELNVSGGLSTREGRLCCQAGNQLGRRSEHSRPAQISDRLQKSSFSPRWPLQLLHSI